MSVVSVSPSVVLLDALGESSEQRESERAPVAVLARPALLLPVLVLLVLVLFLLVLPVGLLLATVAYVALVSVSLILMPRDSLSVEPSMERVLQQELSMPVASNHQSVSIRCP